MKRIKICLLTSLILICSIYIGCDDSGVIPPYNTHGMVSFMDRNLRPLNPNTDGLYQLWVAADTAGTRTWYSVTGRFNVTADGTPVDVNGNPMVFQFAGDTNRLGLATRVLLTVEKTPATQPGGARLMSGILTVATDSITGWMDITGDCALGTVGTNLLQNQPGRYIRWSPTTHNANPTQGIWLCDSMGVSHMPDGLALPASGGWIYQAWLVDKSNNTYRSIGRFYDPKAPDNDGAGPCSGSFPGFNAPGQDWIQTGGDCPSSPINVISGNYGIIVTLEPANEAPGNTPSFFVIYHQDIITSLGQGQLDFLYNYNETNPFPVGRIAISN